MFNVFLVIVLLIVGSIVVSLASLAYQEWFKDRRFRHSLKEASRASQKTFERNLDEPDFTNMIEALARKRLHLRSEYPVLIENFLTKKVTLVLYPGGADICYEAPKAGYPRGKSRNSAVCESQETESLQNVKVVTVSELDNIQTIVKGASVQKQFKKKQTVN